MSDLFADEMLEQNSSDWPDKTVVRIAQVEEVIEVQRPFEVVGVKAAAEKVLRWSRR